MVNAYFKAAYFKTHTYLKLSQATRNGVVGHIWPAGI